MEKHRCLFSRLLLIAGGGILFGLLISALWSPLESTTLSPKADVSVSLSAEEVYTVFLPVVFDNFNGTIPPFGVQFYGALNSASGLDLLAEAGVRWARLPLSWASIEPTNTTPSNYNWSGLDASVINAADQDINLILTIGGQPSWAALYPMGPVTNTEDLIEFVRALVERYDGDGVDDAPGSPKVLYFELYNEPDNADRGHAIHGGWGYWGHKGEEYAQLLQALYPVVKEANPEAKLVFGGIALDWFEDEGGPFDREFLDNVLQACQGKSCFDVMNFHYYPPFRSRWEPYGKDILGKANYVRQKLEEYGFTGIPIICTETGWASNESTGWGSDELQSRYVIKTFVRGMAAGLGVVIWYKNTDAGDPALFGLLDENMQPKSSYKALQVLTDMLSGAIYRSSINPENTGSSQIEGYTFKTAHGRLDVVWTEDDTLYTPDDDPILPLSVDALKLRVVDKVGNERWLYDGDDGVIDGRITLEVGGSPLFLEYHNPENYTNCRFGVGQAYRPIVAYDVSPLNLGWYLDWGTNSSPPRLNGIEYAQVLRVNNGGYSPGGAILEDLIRANPGALWLIGNEPDCIYQDNTLPENYARVYHDAYHFIKSRDPTAKIVAGNVVQPTPLRLQYLDAVLDAYHSLYGEPMPVDAWGIHSFILREASCKHFPDSCWGSEIPPGIEATHGELYDIEDTDNLEIFKNRIIEFRRWMKERGYRETPLFITEYGTLMPHWYEGWDEERGKAFMYGSFDFLLRAKDPELGYSPDNGRLVQRWLWYSLDDTKRGGPLFDPLTSRLLPMGTYFITYTRALSPHIDLIAVDVNGLETYMTSSTETLTITIKARVSNAGNISVTVPFTVHFFDERDRLIGSKVLTQFIEGCGGLAEITFEWPNVTSGTHSVRMVIDPENAIPEADEHNNTATGVILIASRQTFLPLVLKR